MRERRVKLYFVSKEEVFRQCMRPFPDNMAVIQHKELPKGYEILEVQYDYQYGGFMFLVHHPTFPEVKEGNMIPKAELYDTMMVAYTVIGAVGGEAMRARDPTASEIIKEIEVALKPLELSIPQIEIIPDEKKQSDRLYEATIIIRSRVLIAKEK